MIVIRLRVASRPIHKGSAASDGVMIDNSRETSTAKLAARLLCTMVGWLFRAGPDQHIPSIIACRRTGRNLTPTGVKAINCNGSRSPVVGSDTHS